MEADEAVRNVPSGRHWMKDINLCSKRIRTTAYVC